MGSHRIHRIHRSLLLRRNSHRFVGGYGIPAIPTHPATVMFSHRFYGFTQMVRLRRGLSQYTQISQKFIAEKEFPQNSQNTQKFIVEKELPQISRIYTDIYSHRIHGTKNRLAENILPQISQIYTDI